MAVSASKIIDAPIERIWAVVTDIEKAAERIECIKSVEVLEKPESGVVGLKWKETREMFGKEAIETMWIIEAKENEYYLTEAENCGSLYHSKVALKKVEGGVEVTMSFSAKAQTLVAKLISPMMFLMRGMIRKAFEKDLEDIAASLQNSK